MTAEIDNSVTRSMAAESGLEEEQNNTAFVLDQFTSE